MSDYPPENTNLQPKPREHKPEVIRVLREEAEREIKARKAEAGSAPAMPGSDGEQNTLHPKSSVARAETEKPGTGPHREPDGDLRSSRSTRMLVAALLGLVVLAAFGAVSVYFFAPQIARYLPEIEPQLIAYVEIANELRARINEFIDRAIIVMTETVDHILKAMSEFL